MEIGRSENAAARSSQCVRVVAIQLERFVPPKIFLRLEARDTAGNLAAYQTNEPIVAEISESVARISTIEAVQTPSSAWPTTSVPQ